MSFLFGKEITPYPCLRGLSDESLPPPCVPEIEEKSKYFFCFFSTLYLLKVDFNFGFKLP